MENNDVLVNHDKYDIRISEYDIIHSIPEIVLSDEDGEDGVVNVNGEKQQANVVNEEKPTTNIDEERPAKQGSVVSLSSSDSSESETEDELEQQPFVEDEIDFGNISKKYSSVYDLSKFQEEQFLVGVPIRILINEYARQPSQHRLNPNLYVIKIQHGSFKWTLRKRYNHFRSLHAHLEISYASYAVHHPKMLARMEKVPKLSLRPELMMTSRAKIEKRMRKLQRFLQKVVNDDKFRNNKHTIEFLEVSHISFIKEFGKKCKEGEVMKRAGGHTFSKGTFGKMKINVVWHKRWLVIKESFIAYINKDENTIKEVILFDKNFTVNCDKKSTGIRHGLLITNNARNLQIKCVSNRQAIEWMNVIVNNMGGGGSDWIRDHRYDSYAPVRRSALCNWFIDGEHYFSQLADAIKAAQEEIFIADWWLSPEIFLKRPVLNLEEWRLDVMLKERASHGVKVYILLYKEVEMALTINSFYTKKYLSSLHTNIKVLRHPDHIDAGNATLLWAHHEKIVCIDQKICFLGGLDLCYGRWDDQTHRLSDFGSATPMFRRNTLGSPNRLSGMVADSMEDINSSYHREQQMLRPVDEGGAKTFIGKDYYNPYVKDVIEVEKPFTDLIDRNQIPRMPWHDIAVLVVGLPAQDVARHFIQRWNFTKHEKVKEDNSIPFILPKETREFDLYTYSHLTQCDVQIVRSCSLWSSGDRSAESSIHEAYLEHIRNSKHYIYIENQFFITSLKDDLVTNKIGDCIVERILLAFYNKEVFRVYVVMPLLPSFPGEIGTPSATSMMVVESWNLKSCRNIIGRLKHAGVKDPSDFISFYSLRTHADFAGKMATEPVYIHSKLLIVDDSIVVIGSANVNDRSMLGSRDSEIAVCIHDNKIIDGVMNGVKVKVGQFASSLRKKLFQEHLGLLNEPVASVLDPVIEAFYKNAWMHRAVQNSEIYERVFQCLPTGRIHNYSQLEEYKKAPRLCVSDPGESRELLQQIRGFIVSKPLDFLCEQDLSPSAGTNESLVPTKVFT